MLIKNEIYEARIEDYTAEGQGVAKIEGCAVFVPNAIAGELCRIRITLVRKTWAAGKIVEILEKSPHRVNRECPVAKLCGGCDFWHMDYEEEARLKAARVRDCLNRIGGEHLNDLPILSAPTCHGYRNKAQYPVAAKKGKAYAGFFRAGTHQVVENDGCLILPKEADLVKAAVIHHMNSYRISAYDEETHKGLVRHIYVRRGAVSGQILVCIVINGRKLPREAELIADLKKIPGFTTLVLSVNTKPGNAVLGDEFITLFGPGYIEDTLCGLTFRIRRGGIYLIAAVIAIGAVIRFCHCVSTRFQIQGDNTSRICHIVADFFARRILNCEVPTGYATTISCCLHNLCLTTILICKGYGSCLICLNCYCFGGCGVIYPILISAIRFRYCVGTGK